MGDLALASQMAEAFAWRSAASEAMVGFPLPVGTYVGESNQKPMGWDISVVPKGNVQPAVSFTGLGYRTFYRKTTCLGCLGPFPVDFPVTRGDDSPFFSTIVL